MQDSLEIRDKSCPENTSAHHLNFRIKTSNLALKYEQSIIKNGCNPKPDNEDVAHSTQKPINIGSLRLPTDPSWPKIPQRKMANDVGDVIKQPCVVTLSETQRKSRMSLFQESSKSIFKSCPSPSSETSHYHSKNSPATNSLKRRPGCFDPRFKKVTSVQSQITSPDSSNTNKNKLDVLEASQSAMSISAPLAPAAAGTDVRTVPDPPRKPDEKSRKEKCVESVGIQTAVGTDDDKDLNKSAVEKTDPLLREKISIGVKKASENVPKTGRSSENENKPQEMEKIQTEDTSGILATKDVLSFYHQGSGELFFSPIPVKPVTMTQCYNVQVPVFNYQNNNPSIQVTPLSHKIDPLPVLEVSGPNMTPKVENLSIEVTKNDLAPLKNLTAPQLGVESLQLAETDAETKDLDTDVGEVLHDGPIEILETDTACSASEYDGEIKFNPVKVHDKFRLAPKNFCGCSKRKIKSEGVVSRTDTGIRQLHRSEMRNLGVKSRARSSIIPEKTQKLLNKSYWDYYNKLQRDVADNSDDVVQETYLAEIQMGAPELKCRKTEDFSDSMKTKPLSTLEHCRVLSSMINKSLPLSNNLQQTREIFVNSNMKSFSDPTVATASCKKLFTGRSADEVSNCSLTRVKNFKRRYNRKEDPWISKVKTIVLFFMFFYFILVLGQPLYEYYFVDDFEPYEEINWIQFMLNYVVESFSEAYLDIYHLASNIFRRSKDCEKCSVD